MPVRLGEAYVRRITVVGCGHVGLVMAAGFANRGHVVTGLDRSSALVAMLTSGAVPFHEAGLTELVQEGIASGRLRFTTTYTDSVPDAEFIFLTVDTPAARDGAPDVRNIHSAASEIARSLNGTAPIVVNKSTSPVGTAETIETIFRRDLMEGHKRPSLVSNPEFLRQGSAVYDFFHPQRLVIGAHSEHDAREVARLYDGLGGAVLITSLRTAEMIKYVANSFLATRISFINEIAQLCENLDIDIDSVVEGVAHDERIGGHFMKPGIGYGGGCLPKDVEALRHMGASVGVATPVLAAVQHVNAGQRTRAVQKLRAALGSLAGRSIAVWGLTFKGNTEDTRVSPALDVVELLLDEGAHPRIYDPSFPKQLPERIQHATCADPFEALDGADALAVLADWPQFREIPMDAVRRAMAGNVVLDGRNVLDAHAVKASGLIYIGVGRGGPTTPPIATTAARPQLVTSGRRGRWSPDERWQRCLAHETRTDLVGGTRRALRATMGNPVESPCNSGPIAHRRDSAARGWQVSIRGQRKAAHPWRDVRPICLPYFRGRRLRSGDHSTRFRADGGKWDQRCTALHRAAAVDAGRRTITWAACPGGFALGTARRLPGSPRFDPVHRGQGPCRRSVLSRSPSRPWIRDRQRDSLAHRSLARGTWHRALPGSAVLGSS